MLTSEKREKAIIKYVLVAMNYEKWNFKLERIQWNEHIDFKLVYKFHNSITGGVTNVIRD